MIDLIREARARDAAMHVYHYAAYEVTTLKRLTCEYGTREEELDDLLRGEVFVDLFKVVSQGLRLSHERYGLKNVETFFMQELHAAFQPHGWTVAQTVPFDNPEWNYEEYADASDYLMLMAYDQHWLTGEAGSIAAQNWFEHTLSKRVNELDPDKEVVVHCKMGGRSAQAVEFLHKSGFTKAKNLTGGVLAWSDRVDPKMPKY